MRIIALLTSLVLFSTYTFAEPFGNKNNSKTHFTEKNTLLQHYFLMFPPYWQEEENNEFTGLHYRLAQKLYQHANLNVDFINVPYQQLQYQMAQGKTAFINYGETKKVRVNDNYHECIPPIPITLRVYYIKEGLPQLMSMEEFTNKNIIVMHAIPLGNYEGLKSDTSINLMRPRTIEAAIQGLKRNRGDYFIVYENIMIDAQKRFFSGTHQQLKSYPLVTILGYPIVTPKTFPGGEKICAKVSASYKELVKKGVINEKYRILTSDLNSLTSVD